ncbi:MAG: transposase [Dehalobacterium sp.]
MLNSGNRYNEQFKSDAIKLIKEGSRSVYSVAKDLGITPQTLYNWLRKQKNEQNLEKTRIFELEAELKVAKRRNAELEQSVAILKKATAIFATSNIL